MNTQTDSAQTRRAFLTALAANFVWINASEIWRYLAVVKPLLHQTFRGRADIAPFDLQTFAIWSVWDSILILAATGFYWIYLDWAGRQITQALKAATCFTLTVFGLLWLGVFNMGLVPSNFIWAALPLAWVEQAVAALIVYWAMGRNPNG